MSKKGTSFDYKVTKINSKGKVVSHEPYRLIVENGVRKIERPPGSGEWYDSAGVKVSKSGDKKREHVG